MRCPLPRSPQGHAWVDGGKNLTYLPLLCPCAVCQGPDHQANVPQRLVKPPLHFWNFLLGSQPLSVRPALWLESPSGSLCCYFKMCRKGLRAAWFTMASLSFLGQRRQLEPGFILYCLSTLHVPRELASPGHSPRPGRYSILEGLYVCVYISIDRYMCLDIYIFMEFC